MPEESFQEKTEKATPKKRRKAREEGQVARSMELPSVFVLLSGVALLFIIVPFLYRNMVALMEKSLTIHDIPQFNIQYCVALLHTFVNRYLNFVLPVMGTVVCAALVVNFFQVGFHVSFKAIQPKLNRFNIFQGIKRLLSVRSLAELIKSVLKLLIIGMVAYTVIKSESARFPHLYHLETLGILIFILKGIFKIFIGVILIMVVIAVLDYVFQKWQFEQQIKMTKQEVKEEQKQSEGDPQVKSRIRSIQFQAARRRMMQHVPEADVVVTNPTHLAIAIHYSPELMGAPEVVAKGAGMVAERIKGLASIHDIPVVENKKLAQNLYRLVNIGEEIPVEFYQAIAELLAYVYKLKEKTV